MYFLMNSSFLFTKFNSDNSVNNIRLNSRSFLLDLYQGHIYFSSRL